MFIEIPRLGYAMAVFFIRALKFIGTSARICWGCGSIDLNSLYNSFDTGRLTMPVLMRYCSGRSEVVCWHFPSWQASQRY